MSEIFDREIKLIGRENLEKLKNAKVAVFGLGGVGSAVCEGLARGGIGSISLFDGDTINETNRNRQLIALESTNGEKKTYAVAKRLLDINPDINVNENFVFYTQENSQEFDFSQYDYIVDAIDTVSSKIELVLRADEKNVPIISCMGTGNKLDPTRFEIEDLFKTSVCPLAKVMRRELSRRGIKKLKVLYSKEAPRKPLCEDVRTPASISFVPPVAGMIIAGEVIKDIAGVR